MRNRGTRTRLKFTGRVFTSFSAEESSVKAADYWLIITVVPAVADISVLSSVRRLAAHLHDTFHN
jgi:hypothetical protein